MVIKGLIPIFLLFTMECKDGPNPDCKPGNAGYYTTLVQCVIAKQQLPPNITDAQCKRVWGDPK